MKKKKIYISLPISGREMDEVNAACAEASGMLEELGYEPISPLEVSSNPDATYAEHMGRDITALLQCDGMVMLKGYRKSKGCQLEYSTTVIFGIPAFPWKEFLLLHHIYHNHEEEDEED